MERLGEAAVRGLDFGLRRPWRQPKRSVRVALEDHRWTIGRISG
jgi:hypothetical protein